MCVRKRLPFPRPARLSSRMRCISKMEDIWISYIRLWLNIQRTRQRFTSQRRLYGASVEGSSRDTLSDRCSWSASVYSEIYQQLLVGLPWILQTFMFPREWIIAWYQTELSTCYTLFPSSVWRCFYSNWLLVGGGVRPSLTITRDQHIRQHWCIKAQINHSNNRKEQTLWKKGAFYFQFLVEQLLHGVETGKLITVTSRVMLSLTYCTYCMFCSVSSYYGSFPIAAVRTNLASPKSELFRKWKKLIWKYFIELLILLEALLWATRLPTKSR